MVVVLDEKSQGNLGRTWERAKSEQRDTCTLNCEKWAPLHWNCAMVCDCDCDFPSDPIERERVGGIQRLGQRQREIYIYTYIFIYIHINRERERDPSRTNPRPHRKQLQRNPRQQPPDSFKTFTLNLQSATTPPNIRRNPTPPNKTMQKLPKMLQNFCSALPPKNANQVALQNVFLQNYRALKYPNQVPPKAKSTQIQGAKAQQKIPNNPFKSLQN